MIKDWLVWVVVGRFILFDSSKFSNLRCGGAGIFLFKDMWQTRNDS